MIFLLDRLRFRLSEARALRLSFGLMHGTLTIIMLGLALAMALPGDSFAGPAFAAFKHFAPEQMWQLLFSIAFAIGLAGLVASRDGLQQLSAVLLACAHLVVASLFLEGHSAGSAVPTAVFTYTVLAAMGLGLVWVRALI